MTTGNFVIAVLPGNQEGYPYKKDNWVLIVLTLATESKWLQSKNISIFILNI